MKKISLLLVLLLCILFSFSQNLDSIQKVISESSGNEKAEILLELSIKYISKNDSLSLHYINNAIKEINNNDKLKGKAIFHKGMVYRSLKNDVLAISDLKESVSILKNIDSVKTADALYWLERIYQRKGIYPEALKYGYAELDYRKALKDENEIIKALLEIGYTYDRMGDYDEALKWHKKGVKKATITNNKYYKSWGIGLIGIAYDELKMYDSALYYNKKAVKLFKEIDDKYYLKTWYSNIGNTYIKLNDLKKAEEYTLKSLAIDIPHSTKSIALINLGKIYIDSKRYQEAQKILDSAMVIINKNDQKRFASEAYYRYHELRKSQNNYKDALEYFVKHKEVEDELLNEKKAEQITETKIQYDTAEKEKQILIQRADIAEQDLTIQKRNYQLYGLIGLALIFGLIGYLFYNQQILKNHQLKKENDLKDALLKIETQNRLQEQRLRISRDLHDNIGAQLTFIISSIDNLGFGFKINNDKLTSKLKSISEFTASTITDLRDTIWAMNKNQITFDDLQSRISNFIDKAKAATENTQFEFDISKEVDIKKTFSSIEGMNIYRIIQEAINNSVKYAKAENIKVYVSSDKEMININISDNGKGFDETQVELGNGLSNMKKRAKEIQADLEIESKVNVGTTIKLSKSLNT